MPVKFETSEQTRDGCKDFSAVCNGYEVETMAWYGSKSGAENLAGWKWIRDVCYRSAVYKNLYRQLVKKFTFSIVDVETSCRMCKETVDLEELWDHVERCMELRRINYWHERQTNDTN
ncbi:unnamed protein product [Brachionus calyciflorus]|uniref:Uncharacterized protein n=1 Tax=Brachionus calyciflorus TaxID=104777 RepID=A0A813U3N3_9BILA|nr:unnamed protein product [Brachionus calyciflorus]